MRFLLKMFEFKDHFQFAQLFELSFTKNFLASHFNLPLKKLKLQVDGFFHHIFNHTRLKNHLATSAPHQFQTFRMEMLAPLILGFLLSLFGADFLCTRVILRRMCNSNLLVTLNDQSQLCGKAGERIWCHNQRLTGIYGLKFQSAKLRRNPQRGLRWRSRVKQWDGSLMFLHPVLESSCSSFHDIRCRSTWSAFPQYRQGKCLFCLAIPFSRKPSIARQFSCGKQP